MRVNCRGVAKSNAWIGTSNIKRSVEMLLMQLTTWFFNFRRALLSVWVGFSDVSIWFESPCCAKYFFLWTLDLLPRDWTFTVDDIVGNRIAEHHVHNLFVTCSGILRPLLIAKSINFLERLLARNIDEDTAWAARQRYFKLCFTEGCMPSLRLDFKTIGRGS
jgi:hypothetical protein